MVMSVTPMVCVTLALGLGYIGLTLTFGCCDRTYGAAHVTAKRVARLKNENRLREIIWALLRRRIWPALCNAGEVNGKRRERIEHLQASPISTSGAQGFFKAKEFCKDCAASFCA